MPEQGPPMLCYQGINTLGSLIGGPGVCYGECALINVMSTTAVVNTTFYTCDPRSVCRSLGVQNSCTQLSINGLPGNQVFPDLWFRPAIERGLWGFDDLKMCDGRVGVQPVQGVWGGCAHIHTYRLFYWILSYMLLSGSTYNIVNNLESLLFTMTSSSIKTSLFTYISNETFQLYFLEIFNSNTNYKWHFNLNTNYTWHSTVQYCSFFSISH
jgi:hypothetical protein